MKKMFMKKTVIVLSLICVLGACYAQINKDNRLTKEQEIVSRLHCLKMLLYYDFYDSLKKKYYKENDIDIKNSEDTLCYKRLYIIDYSSVIFSTIALDVSRSNYFEDPNLINLMAKWMEKDYMTDSYAVYLGENTEIEEELNKKGDVLFLKALDFYESDDLKNYIDSLRIAEIQELQKEPKKKSNNLK